MDCKTTALLSRGFESDLRHFLIGSIVKWIAFCSLNSAINPSSNLGKNWYLENLSHHLLWKFRKKQNNWRKSYQQCNVLDFFLLYCIFPRKQLMTSWKITTKWFWPGSKLKPFEWLAHMITTTIRNPDKTEKFFDYA